MSTTRIAKNVVANYIGIVGQIVIAFLLTPFLVSSLGDSKYGIWSIAAAFTGYMCLLDLGVSSAVNRYVARYHAVHDNDSVNSIVSTALAIFFVVCLVIFFMSPFLASLIVNAMEFEEDMHDIVYLLIIIVSFDVGVFVVGNLFRGIFGGLQRYGIINYAQIISAVYKAILFYIFLSDGYGLIAMGYISLSANILAGIGYYVLLKRMYPFVSISFKLTSKDSARKIYKFGGYTFLAMLANQIIYYSDAFVIGYFMSAAAVTYYSIPWSLAEYTKRMCLAISKTYTPAISAQESKKDMDSIKEMYISGTKYMIIISNLLTVGIMVLGGALIAIWMGPKYKELCETVLMVLFINLFVQGPQLISYSVLQGLAKQKVYSYVSLGVSIANLVLSIILVQKWGIVGVAIATTVPQVIFYGVFVPLFTLNVLKLSVWQYFKKTYLVTVVPTVVLFAVLAGVDRYLYPESYLTLILFAILCALIYIVFVYFFSLDKSEKATCVRYMKKLVVRR
ncbi:oligosaccharide flippase family protein [Pseudomonadota bacterium]